MPDKIVAWAEAEILEMQVPAAGYGMFVVKFDNYKRQGYGGKNYKCYEAWGALYPSGHVYVDTPELHVHDYRSLQQMQEILGEFGNCTIEWKLGGTA